MMVLTACGGTTSDGTTTTTEPGTTTTDPVEENNVKVAYEAAAALGSETESADAGLLRTVCSAAQRTGGSRNRGERGRRVPLS